MLEKNTLFSDLQEDEQQQLLSLGEIKEYEAGQTIIKEGEAGRELFAILEGEVEVLKLDEKQVQHHKIGTLYSDSFFGDMSFLENNKRSTTIRALTKCKIFIIDYQKVEKSPLLQQLTMTILKTTNQRQKATNEGYAKKLEEEVGHLEKQNQFGKFFIYMFISFGVCTGIDSFARDFKVNTTTLLFNWSYTLLLVIPILLIALACRFKFRDMGVTYHNWLRSTLEGLGFAAILGTIFYFVINYLDSIYNISTKNSPIFPLMIGSYIVNAYLQELMARGIIQTTLQRFFDDERGIKAVLFTSLIFAVVHLHISFTFALITFVGSIIFGFIYVRHKNLFGVTIVHATLGIESVLLGLM